MRQEVNRNQQSDRSFRGRSSLSILSGGRRTWEHCKQQFKIDTLLSIFLQHTGIFLADREIPLYSYSSHEGGKVQEAQVADVFEYQYDVTVT